MQKEYSLNERKSLEKIKEKYYSKFYGNGISVVITCHNYGKYLKECLNSVFSQTKKPLQIILVDDSSTDDTKHISKQYDLEYYYVNLKSPNESRKFGYQKSKGDWIIFLDADDILTSTYLQEMFSCIDGIHDVIFCDVKEFGESDKYYDLNESVGLSHASFCHVSCLVSRNAIEKSKAFEEKNEFFYEDWEFWKRIEKHGFKFKKSKAVLLYRKHLKNRSRLKNKGYVDVENNLDPKKKIAVVTVATGSFFELLKRNHTIETYAKKINADFHAITNTTQSWWGYEKFRVHNYAKTYDYTIFLDIDCVINDSCPNLVELMNGNEVLIFDDYPYLPKDWRLQNDKNRKIVCKSQKIKYKKINMCLNSGVVVCNKFSCDVWKPPSFPLPKNMHVAEQLWVEHNVMNFKYSLLPKEFNNQFWMKDHFYKPCHIRHYSSLSDKKMVFKLESDIMSFNLKDNYFCLK